jgi:hypothetical protein
MRHCFLNFSLLVGMMFLAAESQAMARQTGIEFRSKSGLEVFTYDEDNLPGTANLLRVPDHGDIVVEREWEKFTSIWILGIAGGTEYAVIEQPQHSGLYRVGDWSQPLLTDETGLPVKAVRGLRLNTQPNSRWYGWAFLTNRNMNDPYWKLIVTDDHLNFYESQLESSGGRIQELGRVGSSTLAAKTGEVWKLFTRQDSHWVEVKLDGAPSAARGAQVAGGIGLGLSGHLVDEDRRDWNWFLEDQNDAWRPASALVSGAPSNIVRITVRGKDEGMEVGGFEKGNPVKRFYIKQQQSWVPVESIMPSVPPDLADMVLVLNGRAVGLRAALDLQSAHGESSDWKFYLRDGAWKSMHDSLSLPSTLSIWSIGDFAQGSGLRVTVKSPATDKKSKYSDLWFVQETDHEWILLDKELDLKHAAITHVEGDALGSIIAAQVADDPDRPGVWHIWFKSEGKWQSSEKTRFFPSNTLIDTIDADWDRGTVSVRFKGGSDVLLARTMGNQWRLIPRMIRSP